MTERTCSIPGCDRSADPHRKGARGWCHTHYMRWRRHGNPQHGGEPIRQHAKGSPCTVDECSKPSVARGYCENHYRRWKRYGDATAGKTSPGRPLDERFWEKVTKTATCWLWTDAPNGAGYGTFSVNSTPVMAHRFAYEMFTGKIPDGLTLDHLCRNRLCVRPEHLEPVTNAENLARARAAGEEAADDHRHVGVRG